ncbi:anti-repressor SinI family protein [Paenibacillus macerans]|uniref:Anti-repressor SinI family protein n=1 Tax=Paenibacillus macerans TaxID=44252 RepID=A0A090ZJG5_PAEMA|nr:anti-repressor SinI family protein [Paenibacillus macerans]KFN10528.1 anti-repressor SinI family protein [Paenibacillus macerans]SUD26399.1 Anti-repressor SinI [Paenibacillus macerans]
MLKKSAQVIVRDRCPGEIDPEWVVLLAMAKDAGISIEEVRRFLSGERSNYAQWHLYHK